MQNRKLVWPFSFYFFIFAAIASYGPYMVLYYQSLNFTGTQIGILAGIAPLVSMVSLPLITGLADRTNQHKLIMSFSLVAMMAILLFLPSINTFALLLGVAVLIAIFFSPILSLSNSAAMFMLGEKKDLYGRIRLGGTLGFSIMATLAGALVENFGLKMAFWGAAAIMFIAFLTSQKLVHSEEESGQPVEKGRASELLKNPHFLLFLLIGLCGGISFATLNTYFFPYMKELGAGESIMGLALTIGTISEVPVLFFIGPYIKRFGAYALLIFAIMMTALRFLLLALALTPIMVLLIQLLNGFNFPLLTVAAVTYADERAPKGFNATAQGLFNAAMGGLGAAVGGFVGGVLFEQIGPKGMYLTFSIFLVLVLIFVTIVRKILPVEDQVFLQEI